MAWIKKRKGHIEIVHAVVYNRARVVPVGCRAPNGVRPQAGSMEEREVEVAEHRLVGLCPVCGGKLQVRRLQCPQCDSALEGRFELCRFCQLTREQQEFIEVFIASRGNIKEVERVLGISYPTVRNRLDAVIEALGYKVERGETTGPAERRQILEALDRGEMTAQEAIQKLKGS